MGAEEVIENIRDEVRKVARMGEAAVAIADLEKHLNELDREAQSSGNSDSMTAAEFQKIHVEHNSNQIIKLFESVVDAGKEAIKASLLINGGAAVAIIGGISLNPISKAMIPGLKYFAWGVLAGSLAYGCRYFAQWFFAKNSNRIGKSINFITIIFAIGANLLFGYGSYEIYSRLNETPAAPVASSGEPDAPKRNIPNKGKSFSSQPREGQQKERR